MEKRYQIFISSTFSDLKDERKKVMQTIMSLDCIPAGMELFPAMDEEQFEFIKSIIDDCDYYILIVGARYGSMDDNGVSYTEKEYEYAVSKGVPVLAFLHHDISSIPMNKADLDEKLRKKLEKFRKRVEKGRLVQYWNNADDLNAKVAVSLPKTIKMFPRTGWVRANLMANSESLQEINELRKELEDLRAFKTKYENEANQAIDIADWDEEFCATFTKEDTRVPWDYYDSHKKPIIKISYTWLEWFKMIALSIDSKKFTAFGIDQIISFEVRDKENIKDANIYISSDDLATIRYQFLTRGVITKGISFEEEKWDLTKKGEKLIAQRMCVKTKKK